MDFHHTIVTDDSTDPLRGYLLRASVGEEGTDINLSDGHPWAADADEHEVMRMLNAREVVMFAKWMLTVAEAQIEVEEAARKRRASEV